MNALVFVAQIDHDKKLCIMYTLGRFTVLQHVVGVFLCSLPFSIIWKINT